MDRFSWSDFLVILQCAPLFLCSALFKTKPNKIHQTPPYHGSPNLGRLGLKVFHRNPLPCVQSLKGEGLTPILWKCLFFFYTEYKGASISQAWTCQSHSCTITSSPKLPDPVLPSGYQHEQDSQNHNEFSSAPLHSFCLSQNEFTESR